MLASALKSSSHRRMSPRIIIAAMLVILVLSASIRSSQAAPDTPSVEWSRTFNGVHGNSVIQTADGGYAIAGYVGYQAVLVKTTSSGDVQWQRSYGPEVFGSDISAVSVVQTTDMGYSLFSVAGVLVKTDAEGNVQWNKPLGVTGVREGISSSDGGYLLVGNSKDGSGEDVAWLLKTDEQGNTLWNQKFTGGFVVYTVIETADRGCALAGNWKNDFWFAKIDSNNNLQWRQTFSYGGPSDVHYVYAIAKTKDGGYALAGAGYWLASNGIVPWMIKIDSQGHEKWSLPYGGTPHNGYSAVLQTDDQGYVLTLSNSAGLVRTDTSGSERWVLTYAEINAQNTVGLPGTIVELYTASCLIRTTDGGYATVGTDFGNNLWLTKISPEPDFQPPVVSVLSPQHKTYDTGDISLTFTVNEPTSWIGYSLDGRDNETIAGNITLAGLSTGDHNLTVYAKDTAGNYGASEAINFSIVGRFPVEWLFAGVAVAAAVLFGVLLYFKRQTLSTYKNQGFRNFFKKHRVTAIAENRMVRTLIIMSLCLGMVFVQIFFPYIYFSSSSRNSNSTFEVGVTYVYERDNVGQIYDEVSRIHELGIRVIRVNMVCDSIDTSSYLNGMTDVFFSAVQSLNMHVALIIKNNEDINELSFYLGRWGKSLTYVQILNEPESSSSWDVGALYTDDEAISKLEQVYSTVEQAQLSVQLYTNFGAGFLARTNLPIKFSEKLDFVGLDVFMDSFLTLSPNMVQLLHKITNKDVAITEFGMSTSDDTAQSDYIIRGLNLFKSMGLRGCWIVYWNSAGNYYGIRGRLAEKAVGEWIAQNAKTK
jgi:hypothetical protein